jgi:hypothetical protein
MKRKISNATVSIVFLIICSFVPKFTTAQNDFYTAKWGMSKEQVKCVICKEPFERMIKDDSNSITISSNVKGPSVESISMDCFITFNFHNGILVSGAYLWYLHKSKEVNCIADYSKAKSEYSSHFGNPVKEQQVWTNPKFKNDKSKWVEAIRLGHMYYITRWKKNRSFITLKLTSLNKVLVFLEGDVSAESNGNSATNW